MDSRVKLQSTSFMVFVSLLLLNACVHGQTAKLGGSGGSGGTAGWQSSHPPALAISTLSLPSATANTSYSQTLTAINGIGTLTWSVMLGQLPTGLVLNSSTGTVSGTPTAPGVYTFTILVTDSTSPTAQTATQQFSLNVNCVALQQTSTSPLPSALSGSVYNFQFQSLGGQGSVTWSATGVPAGLTLSSGGALTGTTSAVGTNILSVTATDSCPVPQSVTSQYTLAVNPKITITTAGTLAPATTGAPYRVTLAAQGGTAPYSWVLLSGTLPTGLSLSSTGVISGTPTGVGTSSFTIRVTDSASNTTSQPFTLAVACVPLTVTTGATLPQASQGQQYNFQFTLSGGFGSDTWSLANGTSLPNGLTLSTSGLVSGTPTLSGTYSFDISAADSCPVVQRAGGTFSLTVNGSLTITTSSTLPNGTLGTPYNAQLNAAGGTQPYQWTTPAGTIPAGAIDLLDWAVLPLPTRNTSHLVGTGAPKYFHFDAGMLWWIKGASGNPWDADLYDGTNIYHWFTENGDSSDQAACQAAGFANCFVDPFAYKKFVNPVKLSPRYFVLGGPDVTYTSPAPNRFVRTTNCGTDNQPLLDLGNIVTITHDAGNMSFGGSIGTVHTIIVNYYWGLSNVTTLPPQSGTRERYYLNSQFGQFQWDTAHWNGTTYVIDQTALTNSLVAGGSSEPNFACKVPALPITGGLPPGTPIVTDPQLNLDDRTGIITGTPTKTGTYAFTAQVEDATGTIAQKAMSLTTVCPAFTMTSTSPLPPATQGQTYSYQFLSSGGLAPIVWSRIQGDLPPGLTLSSTGLLSGTPTTARVYNFVPQALDSCSPQQQSVQAAFSLTVQANTGALTIQTSSPLPAATEGTPYSASLSATGGTSPYAWTTSAGSLPSGLVLSSGGVISGTPTATGTASFTAKVTDSLAAFTTKAFNLTVSCPALSTTSTSPLPAATQGHAYSFQFASAGGISPVSWGATGIPAGLTLSSAGLLSGTPTATGTSSLSVTATDSCLPSHQTSNNSFSLTVSSAPPTIAIATTSPLPAATQGAPYNTQMTATGATPPYTWAITSGSLPAGLALSSGGLISGTPTTIGTSTPTIKVTDSLGVNISGVFSLTVSCTALSITTAALPSGTQNSPYSFQMSSSGGAGAITWSLFGGSFPTGVSIASSGLISGTPSTSGSFNPQIRATDSCSTPQTATTTFPLTVNATPLPLQIVTSALPPATQNQAYAATVTATGGTPPYGSWTVTVGTLPTGLSLNSSTGAITGTPTSTGTSSFTVRVTDAVPNNAIAALSLTVNATTGADNRYCTTSGTWIGPVSDGPAALPTSCYNTALTNTPSPGTVRGPVNSQSTFNTAYAAAACGDVILATAGSNLGSVTLTGKNCDDAHYITIKSTGITDPSFPAEGTRATPCISGVASLPGRLAYPCSPPTMLTAQFVAPSSNNAVYMGPADHIRFIGIEFTRVSTAGALIFSIVDLGSANNTTNHSHHIIFDRCYFHGIEGTFPQSPATDTSTTRALYLAQSNHVAVIDSYIANIYDNGNTASNGNTDSQCVGGGTGNKQSSGWGVYKFVNNHCEGGSEGIILGGGGGPALAPVGCTPSVNCTIDVPSDIEVRRNYFFAPNQWNGNTTTSNTAGYPNRKNGMEWKTGARILVEGNVFENCWNNSQPYCYVMDIAAKNQMLNATNPGTCPSCLVQDATLRFNYGYNYPGFMLADYTTSFVGGCSGCGQTFGRRHIFHDNLVGDKTNIGSLASLGFDGCMIFASTAGPLTSVSVIHNTCVTSITLNNMMTMGAISGTGGANTGLLDTFVFQNNLMPIGLFGVQAYTSSGCDGPADNSNLWLLLLNNCVNGVTSTWTVDHNGTWGTLGISNWPPGNSKVADGPSVGFVNFNGGDSGFNPGNYVLTNVSPFHNAGSDGKDLGADILTLQTKIAGVRQ